MKNKFLTLLLISGFYGSFAQDKKPEKFSFIAFGDMPYILPQDYPRFENVIKKINEQNSAFTVNVGDIKSSSTPCSEESYAKVLSYYQQFNKPMIYVPGDNEWTDCGKKEAGSYDSEERLEVIRKMFFKDHNSFGKEKIVLSSQSQKTEYSKFVENNRWEYGNVSFATVHIVGSNNNFLSSSKNGNKEFYEREKADLAWLDEVFKNAKEKNSSALVIVIHADMFSGSKDMKEASGFNEVKKKIKDLALDFKKPVLLINGDSHVLLIDKPFYSSDDKTKKTLVNFTRLQVPGEANMHAVKITVNPDSGALFQFEELIVEGN
jgi:hypothetical protein